MYVAIAQVNPTVGALRENAEKALAVINSLAAATYPPDLVVFPAFALTGAPLGGLVYSDAFAAECLDVAKDFIARSSLPTLIGTVLPRPIEGEFSFFCEPEVLFCREGKGGALGFVDTEMLVDEDVETASVSIRLEGHDVTILLDDFPDSANELDKTDIVIMMLAKEYQGTNTMFTSSSQLNFLRATAQDYQTCLICANLVGGQDRSVFDGASVVIDADGEVICSAVPFKEEVLTCNVIPRDSDWKPTKPKTQLSTQHDKHTVKPLLPYEADWRALELALHDYVSKNGFNDVVIGLSGGIDSAVVATLAVDALGAEHVHGILMPGPYSSEGSVTDARSLAEKLGIQTLMMPIGEPFESIKQQFQKATGQEGSSVAIQNLQARMRMTYLMHLSNSFGWLLINTGNKSEAAMGFSTLYGDTAGAFAPLGNIYKTDVYGLASWRNQQKSIIPQTTLAKAPSAELYPGQLDSDTLPEYELLDQILRLHIEDGLGVDQIMEYSGRQPEGRALDSTVVSEVLSSVRKAEYKRRQEPLAPTLGSEDMGDDRNWPLTNGFIDHDRNLSRSDDLLAYMGLIYRWDIPGGWDISAN
ncbi:MAG: NAD(+) synthase [Coriobacteriaceae bacterium]|nr:NAD(+) synthase [Coriobacteriaceae bacterium]